MVDKRRELFAELRGVLLAQIDLVFRAGHAEPHGLVRRSTVKVVFQRDDCPSCHPYPQPLTPNCLDLVRSHCHNITNDLPTSSPAWPGVTG
jgi:hypothetical protein